LVVRVGVDDHVGAELEGRVDPGLEGNRQALVRVEADDVVDPALPSDPRRRVGGAVIDDQPLDGVEPLELTRQVAQSGRQNVFLVEAGVFG
jgi:hypothetical protein